MKNTFCLLFVISFAIISNVNAQNEKQKFWALNSCNLLLSKSGSLIPSTVNVAYSVRKLDCKYSGPCMKVRIGNNGAEANVAFYGTVVSPNSIVTVTKTGSGFTSGNTYTFSTFYAGAKVYVITWYDQSGNGNNATNTSNPPLIVNSGTLITENNYPSIEFSGAHTTINLILTSAINLTSGSLFGVYNATSSATTCGIAQYLTSYSYNVNTYNNTGKLGATQYGTTDAASAISYNTTLDITCWSKLNTNPTIEINTRLASSTAYNPANVNIPIAVSQIYGNALAATTLHISELIVTDYATSNQRAAVFTNQRSFFNTP